AFPGVAAPQDRAWPRFVDRRDELEVARRAAGPDEPPGRAAGEATHRPAGHRPGEFGDVGLAVAAMHAERVQLHDLARQILVEPEARALLLRIGPRPAPRTP